MSDALLEAMRLEVAYQKATLCRRFTYEQRLARFARTVRADVALPAAERKELGLFQTYVQVIIAWEFRRP